LDRNAQDHLVLYDQPGHRLHGSGLRGEQAEQQRQEGDDRPRIQ